MCAWCSMDVVLRRGSALVCVGVASELGLGSRRTLAVAWTRGVDDGHRVAVSCCIRGAQATRAGSLGGPCATVPGPESASLVLGPWSCMPAPSVVAAARAQSVAHDVPSFSSLCSRHDPDACGRSGMMLVLKQWVPHLLPTQKQPCKHSRVNCLEFLCRFKVGQSFGCVPESLQYNHSTGHTP